MVEKDSLIKLLDISLLEFQFTFLTHSHSKQMSLFFGPPENQQAKCLKHPKKLLP